LVVPIKSSGDVPPEDHFLRAAIEKWAGWGGSDAGRSARPALADTGARPLHAIAVLASHLEAFMRDAPRRFVSR
jgi:hypothetical protein